MSRGPAKALQLDRGVTAFNLLAGYLRAPLMRNGYSLIVNTALTSVLGLLFWIFAARLYSVEQVGIGTALLSLLLTIGNISQLAFGNMLNRFLPVAGNKTAGLIVASAAVASLFAFAITMGFIVFLNALAPSLDVVLNGALGTGIFIASAVAWTLFSLQDSILSGLRSSSWIPLKNTLFGVAKLGLLAPFAERAWLEPGLFTAWIVPLPAIIIGVSGLIFWKIYPTLKSICQPTVTITFWACARFFGWEYIGILALVIASSIATFMVLNLAGAAAAAAYNLTYAISFSLYLVGRSMSIALLSETAVDSQRIQALSADALVHTFVVLIPATLFFLVAAPFVMSLFGPYYTEHAVGLLRVLALMCLPWSFNTIYMATARINNELKMLAVVQVATAVLALGFGFPLVHSLSAFGMGLAWFLAQTIVALGILVNLSVRHGRGGLLELGLHLASSLARLRSTFRVPQAGVDEPTLRKLLGKTSSSFNGTLRAMKTLRTQSDVLTTFIAGDMGVPEFVYKKATSQSGRSSLLRSVEQAKRVRLQSPADHRAKIPDMLAFENTFERAHSIEPYIAGEGGQKLVMHAGTRSTAIGAALAAFANLRDQSEAPATIDEAWLSQWIESPVLTLQEHAPVLMTPSQRHEAIKKFTHLQLQYWKNSSHRLGLGHGDFSPNNLLYAHHSGRGAQGKMDRNPDLEPVQVSAILDWESATTNAPSGFDPCFLFLTVRALAQGQELGNVIRDMLLHPQWTPEELSWFASGLTHEDWVVESTAMRAMVGLVWLKHVTTNLKKSRTYSGSKLWIAWNVDRVLDVFLKDLSSEK